MCPELFHIGSFAVRPYGLTLGISFFIGLWLAAREARIVGVDPERVIGLCYVLIVFGMIGGRLAYVLYHLSEFAGRPLDIINPFGSSGQIGIAGLNLQGGLVLGLIAGIVYLRKRQVALGAAFDAAVPAAAFGIFLTRIGCFLNGCCHGVPTDVAWGMSFPEGSIPYAIFGDQALHPTQLYSSAAGLFLFGVLLWVNRRWYREGRTLGVFLMLEAVLRLLIEPWRYYESEMWFSAAGMRVTYNQLVAVATFLIGAVFIWRPARERKTA